MGARSDGGECMNSVQPVSQAQWKAGKRRAEKDEFVGAAFLTSIELPDVTVEMQEA